MKLKYGKYKHVNLDEVPTEHLEFLLTEMELQRPPIEQELKRRKLAANASVFYMEEIVSAGFKILAQKYSADCDPSGIEGSEAAKEKLMHLISIFEKFEKKKKDV